MSSLKSFYCKLSPTEAGPWPELVPMVFDLANENVEAWTCDIDFCY